MRQKVQTIAGKKFNFAVWHLPLRTIRPLERKDLQLQQLGNYSAATTQLKNTENFPCNFS